MATESEMLATIGAIYDAGLDPALWPAAFERIAELLDTTLAGIALVDSHARVLYRSHVRLDERAILDYVDTYSAIDPLAPPLLARPPGQAFSQETLLPTAELIRSRVYDEWRRPNDLEHSMGAYACRGGERSAFLIFGRPRRKEPFSPADVDVVTKLLPHVAGAVRVQTRLQAAEVSKQSTAAALDRMPQAVMLVSAEARVLHANEAAARLLRDGRSLDEGASGLDAGRPEQTEALHTLIARASRPGLGRVGGSMLLHQPGRGDRLVVHVVPCRGAEVAWADGPLSAAIVIVAEPRRRSTADVERALQTLLGLTPAEARTACFVAEGIGIEAAAGAVGAKPSTVRTHLLRVYQKTGTGRQAELAELIGQVASAVGPGIEP